MNKSAINTGKPSKANVLTSGLWTPTPEEIGRLRLFKNSRQVNNFKVLFVNGRQPFVSFLLAGRDPIEWPEAGETYFVTIKGGMMADKKRVRRVVRIYPWDTGLPDDLKDVDLDYLLRPITVFEAWRAHKKPTALVRKYSNGMSDYLENAGTAGWYRAVMWDEEDQETAGPVELEWFEIQNRVDLLDQETSGDVDRPDWRLQGGGQ